MQTIMKINNILLCKYTVIISFATTPMYLKYFVNNFRYKNVFKTINY